MYQEENSGKGHDFQSRLNKRLSNKEVKEKKKKKEITFNPLKGKSEREMIGEMQVKPWVSPEMFASVSCQLPLSLFKTPTAVQCSALFLSSAVINSLCFVFALQLPTPQNPRSAFFSLDALPQKNSPLRLPFFFCYLYHQPPS